MCSSVPPSTMLPARWPEGVPAMTEQSPIKLTEVKLPEASRRRFLQGAGAAGLGLVVGFHWMPRNAVAATSKPEMLNAFIRIAPDNTVTVLSKHVEKIGRASCRERVCKYVSISVVPVSINKKKQ